ncbi:CRAL-TRIO domain-containing protein [Flagelloscypha sp. PMI_526]|nr:CRAL-TRIO domain-containing protein [Flagelloscypha sp. PMI_526]
MPKTRQFITQPAPGITIAPVHEYSKEQHTQMEELKQYAQSVALPSTNSYYQFEQKWLSKPDTIPRYCRAAKWNKQDAEKRIKGSSQSFELLEWRRDFKPELIPPDEVKVEAETAKIPIIYMRPGNENTPRRNVPKDMMPPGQESLVIIVDYKTTTLKSNPSISIARKVLTILQAHYVETLGRAIVVNLPTLLSFFYKGISPFLDPVTRDKMRFNPDLLELVPASQLDAEFGGEYEFEHHHETYWNQVVSTTDSGNSAAEASANSSSTSSRPESLAAKDVAEKLSESSLDQEQLVQTVPINVASH